MKGNYENNVFVREMFIFSGYCGDLLQIWGVKIIVNFLRICRK